MNLDFFTGKKVFITGHTGFKGSWLCKILVDVGAEVTGYALAPEGEKNLFSLLNLDQKMQSIVGDIRDFDSLSKAFEVADPEIVIHMAAQPLVRTAYEKPVYTYDVNVMGTVNILECVRQSQNVKSFLNVTTDKVYKNKEWEWGYRENEELNGYDPYSNSKSCSELVTESYKKSFLRALGIAVSTARAGNVIGGGDYAKDRIIPDCIRAIESRNPIIIRNPYSIRPYQHVLEPLSVYLMIVQKQMENPELAGNYNVGPNEEDCIRTGELTALFCKEWEKQLHQKAEYVFQADQGPHEANFLKLDCARLKATFGWSPKWNIHKTVEKIIEWEKEYLSGNGVEKITERQINDFFC